MTGTATDAPRLGAAIKALRYEHGLTTAALAKKVGITDRYLRYLERGAYTPSAPVYRKLTDVLGALPAITEAS